MRFLIATIVVLLLLPVAFAMADPKADFQTAVERYNVGEYDSALTIFKALDESGFDDARLFYNLGNCYYKTGQKGLAVAYYLKARRLNPRDADIHANLNFVRGTLRDKYEDSLQNPIWGFIRDSAQYFKANELTWILVFSYLGVIGTLIFLVLFKRKNLVAMIVMIFFIGVIVISGSLLGINVKMNYRTPMAVIIDPEVEVLAGPGAISEVRFTAHEGLTFRILRQESGYFEGIFANNLKGWVENSKAFQF